MAYTERLAAVADWLGSEGSSEGAVRVKNGTGEEVKTGLDAAAEAAEAEAEVEPALLRGVRPRRPVRDEGRAVRGVVVGSVAPKPRGDKNSGAG